MLQPIAFTRRKTLGTRKKYTATLINASEEAGIEINTYKTKHILLSSQRMQEKK
jgi:hypothetical protein